MKELRRCDNCQIQYICIVKENFEKSLLNSRTILEKGDYPDLCTDIITVIAKRCKLFIMDDDEFYGK